MAYGWHGDEQQIEWESACHLDDYELARADALADDPEACPACGSVGPRDQVASKVLPDGPKMWACKCGRHEFIW